MKSKLMAVVSLLIITVLLATSQVSAITNVVTPEFVDHQGEATSFDPAYVEFSAEETILGAHSVKMYIPEGAIPSPPPEVWNLGLNAEVRLATGMSRSRGLVLYNDVSFKAKMVDVYGGQLPYVSLILYDRTHDVWVSMVSYEAVQSGPDGDGWYTITVPSSANWWGWTFGGGYYGPVDGSGNPAPCPLSGWDKWIATNHFDVDVRKVNIQFGYYAYGLWGTVYVDGLSFAGRILDFEP